jgi:hypothetical protein
VRGLKTWCEVRVQLWFLVFRGQEWCLYVAGIELNSKRRKEFLSPWLEFNGTEYWGSKILPSEMHSNTIYIYIYELGLLFASGEEVCKRDFGRRSERR